MIELELTKAAEDYGRWVVGHYQAEGVRNSFEVPGRDKRWTGHAVEHALNDYFAGLGFPFVWNGGMDDKPDFELGPKPSLRVSCKSNSGDAPRPDFIFAVPEARRHDGHDGTLFSIVQVRDRRIWVAGYVSADRFRAESKRVRKGQDGFVPGRPMAYDCRVIRADALAPAETLLELIGRCT